MRRRPGMWAVGRAELRSAVRPVLKLGPSCLSCDVELDDEDFAADGSYEGRRGRWLVELERLAAGGGSRLVMLPFDL